MSTPAAIRFLDRDELPFSGLYIHYDASLELLIENLLEINKRIVWYPIRMLQGVRETEAREQVSNKRRVPQSELIFASDIEAFSICFSAMYFNMMNRSGLAEGGLSMLKLDSRYKNNIVYSIDIHMPHQLEHTLDNEPSFIISTGSGKEMFKGDLSQLKKEEERGNFSKE